MTQKEITLSNPIISGKTEIKAIIIRKPLAGDLRGVKMFDFLEADINALAKVLPRITTPTLVEQDIYQMELGDISKFIVEIANFLNPTSSSVTQDSPTE